jgi:hypothetical protein
MNISKTRSSERVFFVCIIVIAQMCPFKRPFCHYALWLIFRNNIAHTALFQAFLDICRQYYFHKPLQDASMVKIKGCSRHYARSYTRKKSFFFRAEQHLFQAYHASAYSSLPELQTPQVFLRKKRETSFDVSQFFV